MEYLITPAAHIGKGKCLVTGVREEISVRPLPLLSGFNKMGCSNWHCVLWELRYLLIVKTWFLYGRNRGLFIVELILMMRKNPGRSRVV